MNKRSTQISLAVAIALGQLATSQLAQADSVRGWGNWESSTPSENTEIDIAINDIQTNSNNETSSNNMNVLLDRTTKAALPADTGWIGYNLASPCYSGCDNVNSPNKTNQYVAGDMTLVLNNTGIAPTPPANTDMPIKLMGGYLGTVTATGTFGGSPLNFSSPANYLFADSQGAFSTPDSLDGYMSTEEPIIPGDSKGASSVLGFMGIGYGSGSMLIGRATPLTQMTEQLRLGQTYNYYGNSMRGSQVSIGVSFANASWNGYWGGNSDHNGFTASGTIAGNNITSTALNGLGESGTDRHVLSGKVDGKFIGTFAGTDASGSAIIGKEVLAVQQVTPNISMVPGPFGPQPVMVPGPIITTTVTKGDIFQATTAQQAILLGP